ncbi:MAG: hypothetical protein EXX96DRAFT_281116 [Benjaminiella poitrasii]|nr:MAG: hypothetical protein EXX96DRAFT_281116 [Benjaminiella poitrasii]
MLNEVTKESAFLVTNASGRHINLLNDNDIQQQQQPMMMTAAEAAAAVAAAPSPPSSVVSDENLHTDSSSSLNTPIPSPGRPTQFDPKRKYHCTEPGCTKSFTTSGHLARHFRIHTGEKNFPCLFPGCLSRFSRQDNMMQHYRTHMSPKSRKSQKRVISEDPHPRPRLHAHQRIRSDPYGSERPLTIDQHLSNYRQSLLTKPSSSAANLVESSANYNNTNSVPVVQQQQDHLNRLKDTINQNKLIHVTPAATTKTTTLPIYNLNHPSSITASASLSKKTNDVTTTTTFTLDSSSPEVPQQPEITFYQHKPLHTTFKRRKYQDNSDISLPFTLLHPTKPPSSPREDRILPQQQQQHHRNNTVNHHEETSNVTTTVNHHEEASNVTTTENNTKHTSTPSQAGLLQLAHIVSTFG